MQDLWQVHNPILSIIFPKAFIELCAIKYEYCDCFFEYINFKGDLIKYKCLYCNKNYQHKFDENLKERLFNTYKISNHDKNKFCPYEYMDD